MKTFLDTNVLIYWVDAGPRADQVEQWLADDAVISVQVLNEFANVLRKKRNMPFAAIVELVDTLLHTCEVCDLTVRVHCAALANSFNTCTLITARLASKACAFCAFT